MAKPWSSCKPDFTSKTTPKNTAVPETAIISLGPLGLGVIFLLLSFLLTSCLDLEVSTVFKTSTSGTIQIDALAYRLAQGLQVVEGSDRVPFPSTQSGWIGIVGQVPGTSLISWQGTDEDLGFRTKTIVSFANARALEGLFVVFKQKLTLLQDNQGQWTLTFDPLVPRVTGGDPATRKLWTDLWGKVVWTFGFTPPGKSRVDRTVALADLAENRPPAEWTVSW